MSTGSELRIGDLIGGIEIEARIGSGGFGVVYRGRDPRGAVVAVKVLTPGAENDADIAARLMKEATIMAEIEADNVVRFHAAGKEGARIWLAMEYVSGGTLRDKLPKGRPIDLEQALRWARQIAEGCAELHKLPDASGRPVVHRDLKPENVLLTRDGLAKVTDFGIAKFRTSLKSTTSNEAIGTPLYMAPEQMEGTADIDVRADIFAVGVMLYEMLSGARPAEAGQDRELTLMEKVTRSILQPVVPLPELNPDVPEYVWAIAEKALQKKPQDRFATMRELADELLGALKRVRKARGKKPSFAEVKLPDPSPQAAAVAPAEALEGPTTPVPVAGTAQTGLETATTQPAPRIEEGAATTGTGTPEDRLSTLGASSRSVRLHRSRGLLSVPVIFGGLVIGAVVGVLAFRSWTSAASGPVGAAPPDAGQPEPAADAQAANAAAVPSSGPGAGVEMPADAGPTATLGAAAPESPPGHPTSNSGQTNKPQGTKPPAPPKKCVGIVCGPDL